MKKALVIKYTPRNGRSRTLRLLNTFKQHLNGYEIREIDLSKNIPEFFLEDNLNSYFKRNYMGEELNNEEKQAISNLDYYLEAVLESDLVVIAHPMFNFSMPAIVKAFYDAILQKGKTWDVNETGYIGLIPEKKFLLISSSAGDYSENSPFKSWDFNSTLTKTYFEFMGIKDYKIVHAHGLMDSEKEEGIIARAENELVEITNAEFCK